MQKSQRSLLSFLFCLASLCPLSGSAQPYATYAKNNAVTEQKIVTAIAACSPGAMQFTLSTIRVSGQLVTTIINIGDSPDILVFLGMTKDGNFHCLASMGGGVFYHDTWVQAANKITQKGIRISPSSLHAQVTSKKIKQIPVYLHAQFINGRLTITHLTPQKIIHK